jgi:predicted phage terminase large subunit-like protein
MGNYLFSCNYLNNPTDKDHAKFKQDWIRYYPANKNSPLDRDCPNLSEMNIYTTLDPAISERVEGDFSGFITVGVDSENNKFILETKRLKVNPKELIDEVFEVYKRFKPISIGIEMSVFQKSLKTWIQQEMFRRNVFLPIVELKSMGKSKEYRISGLQPFFEFGAMYLSKSMRELEDELLTFPIMRHDDLIDPLAYQVDMWSPPMKHEVKTVKKGTFAWWMKQAVGEPKKKYLIGHDDYKEKARV